MLQLYTTSLLAMAGPETRKSFKVGFLGSIHPPLHLGNALPRIGGIQSGHGEPRESCAAGSKGSCARKCLWTTSNGSPPSAINHACYVPVWPPASHSISTHCFLVMVFTHASRSFSCLLCCQNKTACKLLYLFQKFLLVIPDVRIESMVLTTNGIQVGTI